MILSGLLALNLWGCGEVPWPEGALVSGCEAWLGEATCYVKGDAGAFEVVVWGDAEVRGGRLLGEELVDGAPRRRLAVVEGDAVSVGGRAFRVVTTPPGCDPAPSDDGSRAWCAEERARRAFHDEPPDVAEAAHLAAIGGFERAGWTREAAMARLRVAFARAERGLEPDLPPLDGLTWDGPVRYMDALVRAIDAREVGAVAAALAHLQDADVAARRRGCARCLATDAWERARLRRELGRFEPGWAAPPAPDRVAGCADLDGQWRVAWDGMDHADVGVVVDLDALRDRLEAAWTVVEAGECAGRLRRADLLVDRARLARLQGDDAGAAALLDQVDAAEATVDALAWRATLRAELALGRGALDEAAVQAAEGDRLAAYRGNLRLLVRCAAVEAEVRRRTDGPSAAAAVWDEALRALVDRVAEAPLRLGRASMLGHYSAAGGAHVDLLLQAGRPADALEVARRWRSQIVRSLAASDAAEGLHDTGVDGWRAVVQEFLTLHEQMAELARRREVAPLRERARIDADLTRLAEEEERALDTGANLLGLLPEGLRDARPGEVLVAVVETRHDGRRAWRGIVRSSSGVAVGAPIVEGPGGLDAEALLAPFAAQLRAAERVTLLVPGAVEALDLHAVTVDGAALITRAPVAWSLDLTPPDPVRTGRALVVGDPEGNLAHARQERDVVHGALVARGWRAEVAGAGTTELDLLRALGATAGEGLELLHFAGHAEFGEDGWSSRLRLARDTALAPRHVLAAKPAPRVVVLAGCETARTLPIGVSEPGLAQTFVVAGSEAVIATARPVSDDLARAFSEALYAADPRLDDPVAAFRAAVSRLAVERPGEDWRAFRVLVP